MNNMDVLPASAPPQVASTQPVAFEDLDSGLHR
jgi:hypothetical protein